jgi:DNA-directed RNA polymerase specialized sigma24 family protein
VPKSTRRRRGGKDPAEPPLDPLPPLDTIRPEHVAYVRTVIARLGLTPTHLHEDAEQEVLARAFRARSSLDVRALLYGITRHVLFGYWSKLREIVEAHRAARMVRPRTTSDIEAECIEAERAEAVFEAIDELPDILREVFVAVELHHRTVPDIAAELGISANTGYTRLRLARARFLTALQRQIARRRL